MPWCLLKMTMVMSMVWRCGLPAEAFGTVVVMIIIVIRFR